MLMNESHSFNSADVNQNQQVSRLYSIQPIDCGLENVESLTSYISRLAVAHCVPAGLLMTKEITPLIKPKYNFAGEPQGGRLGRTFANETSALNGYGSWATEVVNVIEKLTCRTNISKLTFLNWRKVLSNRKLLKQNRAWYPLCFSELLDESKVLYEPLNWSIEILQLCSTHRTPLSNICPHCEKENSPLAWYSRPGFCSKCRGWLGIDAYRSKFPNLRFKVVKDEEQLHCIECVRDLLCLSPDSFYDDVRVSIASHLNHFSKDISRDKYLCLAQVLDVSVQAVREWCKGKSTPTLASMIKICYKFKIDFSTLFEPIYGVAVNENCELEKNHQDSSKKLVSRRSIEKQTLIKLALEAALLENPPKSLNSVANKSGMHPKTMRFYERSLCKQVSNNYARFRTQKKDERIEGLLQEMKKIAQSLYSKGIIPTPSRIAPHMSNPASILTVESRKKLEQFLQENEWF
ncbi:hypothetical protein C7293_03210 [filamentous cyanobacterium CCT1]|nr:hypothetical protein C7293_03210 [filamentous cyanobacterium CCT1]PSN81368.1 hypothetical protein C8B47_01745 [filamentous cyanobacterium CCP4]